MKGIDRAGVGALRDGVARGERKREIYKADTSCIYRQRTFRMWTLPMGLGVWGRVGAGIVYGCLLLESVLSRAK